MHVHVLAYIYVWMYWHVFICICVGALMVVVGDIFQSLLCRFLIVLGHCLPLCTINSIICTLPSQPASPWAIVFPSGVSALGTACHACPPTVGTGLARPRWDMLAFGHCPLQEGCSRREGDLGEGEWPPQQARGREWVPLLSDIPAPVQGWGGVSGWGWEALRGHLRVPWASSSIWSLCREDSVCDKPAFRKQSSHSFWFSLPFSPLYSHFYVSQCFCKYLEKEYILV